jgi:membrane dipeptidase
VYRVPEGLNDVSYYPDLFALLAEDPAWTEENLRKLAGENLIRVFSDVERVHFFFIFLKSI